MPPLGRLTPSRWLIPTTLVVAILLLGGWWQPWRSRGVPTATPTPRIAPAPTGTVAQLPDRLITSPTPPTAAPVRSITPSPVRPFAPSPVRPVPPGRLLYLGRVDGPPGIVAVDAASGERRLLVPGVYVALAWSPDGARFAALGGNGYEQIAIFAAEGRPLARYPVPAGTQCDLRWSPDSRFVACVPSYPFLGRERTTILIADESGLRSALLPPVARTAILGWPQPGVLGVLALPEEWPYAASEVWLIDLASGVVQRLLQGDFLPLGWTADGASLLALGGRQPRGGTVQPGDPVFTALLAIDSATGTSRTLTRPSNWRSTPSGPTPLPGTGSPPRHSAPPGANSPSGSRAKRRAAHRPPRILCPRPPWSSSNCAIAATPA